MSAPTVKGPIVKGPIVKGPTVNGWCPGAYRPMVSGDGLVVRVRPWLGQLSAAQTLALCDVAAQFGSATLELTSRANVQLRGIAEPDFDAVIAALQAADLLDRDPAMEARRNVLMTPDWRVGDLSHDLGTALLTTLADLPELPAKFGYTVDTAPVPWLRDAPADVRFERDMEDNLILVADGAKAGLHVSKKTAMDALQELTAWFIATGGREAGRMARHLSNTPLPPEWQNTPRRSTPTPTRCDLGTLMGAPFGQIDTRQLVAFLSTSDAQYLRVLPGRKILALGPHHPIPQGFCAPDDPLLSVHACTGAPGCPQANGATRDLARALASNLPLGETLHVSGCTKGCAHPRAADHTFIAAPDGFDLVSKGAPWDAPMQHGLSAKTILANATLKDVQT